jgi:hypothetical protein
MHAKPLGDDMREKAWAQQALVDHARRTLRSASSSAALTAAIPFLRDLVHYGQLDAHEFAAHVLADLLHLAAAAAAAAQLLLRQLVGRADARQVRRQLLATLARLAAWRRLRDLDRAVCAGCLGCALGFLDELCHPEMQLSAACLAFGELAAAALLRAAAEGDATEDLDVVLELADQVIARSQLLLECRDADAHFLDFTRVRLVRHAHHDPLFARTATVVDGSFDSSDRFLRSASRVAQA